MLTFHFTLIYRFQNQWLARNLGELLYKLYSLTKLFHIKLFSLNIFYVYRNILMMIQLALIHFHTWEIYQGWRSPYSEGNTLNQIQGMCIMSKIGYLRLCSIFMFLWPSESHMNYPSQISKPKCIDTFCFV